MDTKLNKFSIISREKYDRENKLEVAIAYKGKFHEIAITLFSFEMWVRRTGKLELQQKVSNQGEPEEQNKTISFSEYWDQRNDLINTDILEYISTHPMKDKSGMLHADALQLIADTIGQKTIYKQIQKAV